MEAGGAPMNYLTTPSRYRCTHPAYLQKNNLSHLSEDRLFFTPFSNGITALRSFCNRRRSVSLPHLHRPPSDGYL